MESQINLSSRRATPRRRAKVNRFLRRRGVARRLWDAWRFFNLLLFRERLHLFFPPLSDYYLFWLQR